MNTDSRGTLLRIPLIRERYGPAFLASFGLHILVVLMILFGGYLLPATVVQLGSGPGGGSGGDVATVGVVDNLSGGAGMIKPSVVPKPPALKETPVTKDRDKAIPIPQTIEQKKKKTDTKDRAKSDKEQLQSNVIPTAPEPGSGGMGGTSGGSGGGFGGGNGISIGPGSGGFGDSWYAREVEKKISRFWQRPPKHVRVEISYSFYIASNGTIGAITLEKSSGSKELDGAAEHAIQLSSPLPPPPPEFRGRPIQFVAQFIYPPTP